MTGTGADFVPMGPEVDRDIDALEAQHPELATMSGLAYFRWRFTNLFVDPVPAQVVGLREVLADHRARCAELLERLAETHRPGARGRTRWTAQPPSSSR